MYPRAMIIQWYLTALMTTTKLSLCMLSDVCLNSWISWFRWWSICYKDATIALSSVSSMTLWKHCVFTCSSSFPTKYICKNFGVWSGCGCREPMQWYTWPCILNVDSKLGASLLWIIFVALNDVIWKHKLNLHIFPSRNRNKSEHTMIL